VHGDLPLVPSRRAASHAASVDKIDALVSITVSYREPRWILRGSGSDRVPARTRQTRRGTCHGDHDTAGDDRTRGQRFRSTAASPANLLGSDD
jgi:hypothetical protein